MCLLKPGISDTADQSLRQFTFHYVSIKTKIPAPVYFVLYKFTFHYVSIKTGIRPAIVIQNAVFTFHYVSIKTTITALSVVMLQNSHSTMYLLKLYEMYRRHRSEFNSHSTMYLLKLLFSLLPRS